MNRKRFQILTMVFMAVFLLTGCRAAAAVYDDDAQIARSGDSYMNFNSTTQSVNGHYSGSMGRMEGMLTIWSYRAKEDMEVDIAYFLQAAEGKAKLALISPKGEVTTLVEATPESSMEDFAVTTVTLEKGENRIKLVGAEKTKLNYELEIPVGDFRTED